MEEINKIIKKMRDNGVKITPQRIAIIEYLENNHYHPTAEDIYKTILNKFPTISFATVYNTLEKLEEIKEVKKLKITDDNKVNYEYNIEPHQHFYCIKCNTIYDVNEITEFYNKETIGGHKIYDVNISFKGLCKNCINRKN